MHIHYSSLTINDVLEYAFYFITSLTSHMYLIFNGHYRSSYFLWNLHSVTTYFVDVQIFLVLSNQEKLITHTIFFWKTKKELCIFVEYLAYLMPSSSP